MKVVLVEEEREKINIIKHIDDTLGITQLETSEKTNNQKSKINEKEKKRDENQSNNNSGLSSEDQDE